MGILLRVQLSKGGGRERQEGRQRPAWECEGRNMVALLHLTLLVGREARGKNVGTQPVTQGAEGVPGCSLTQLMPVGQPSKQQRQKGL